MYTDCLKKRLFFIICAFFLILFSLKALAASDTTGCKAKEGVTFDAPGDSWLVLDLGSGKDIYAQKFKPLDDYVVEKVGLVFRNLENDSKTVNIRIRENINGSISKSEDLASASASITKSTKGDWFTFVLNKKITLQKDKEYYLIIEHGDFNKLKIHATTLNLYVRGELTHLSYLSGSAYEPKIYDKKYDVLFMTFDCGGNASTAEEIKKIEQKEEKKEAETTEKGGEGKTEVMDVSAQISSLTGKISENMLLIGISAAAIIIAAAFLIILKKHRGSKREKDSDLRRYLEERKKRGF